MFTSILNYIPDTIIVACMSLGIYNYPEFTSSFLLSSSILCFLKSPNFMDRWAERIRSNIVNMELKTEDYIISNEETESNMETESNDENETNMETESTNANVFADLEEEIKEKEASIRVLKMLIEKSKQD